MAASKGAAALALLHALTLGCSDHGCFVGQTLIATPKGSVRIDALQVGDVVFSYSATEGLVPRRVRAIHVERVGTICRLRTASATLAGVTPSHPFFDAAARAYAPLRDLRASSRLRVFEDSARYVDEPIADMTIEEAPEPCFEVFNLTVDGPEHNYIADGVLVHNKSPPDNENRTHCGDGLVEEGEACDDGNTVWGDGCSGHCELEGVGGSSLSSGTTSTSSSTGAGQGGGGFGGAGGFDGTGGLGGTGGGGGSA